MLHKNHGPPRPPAAGYRAQHAGLHERLHAGGEGPRQDQPVELEDA